mgnify:CR=1 FL=1
MNSADHLVCLAWHWSVGMLRRPELDEEYGFCYEMPDGDLVYTIEPRLDRKSTRLNSSHVSESRMPSSA